MNRAAVVPGIILCVQPEATKTLSMTKRIHPNTKTSALATQGTMVPFITGVWEGAPAVARAVIMFVMTFEACMGPLPKEGRLSCRSCFSLHTHDRRICSPQPGTGITSLTPRPASTSSVPAWSSPRKNVGTLTGIRCAHCAARGGG
jgi:hypothetical protein